jgi:hypothetical protein
LDCTQDKTFERHRYDKIILNACFEVYQSPKSLARSTVQNSCA